MCGIAGYLGRGDNRVLEDMVAKISHRGPDATGIFSKEEVGLAHARLSIIDLSQGGAQPMFNEDCSVAVILNGEIYNYRQLQESLKHEHKFKGASDTEVIVHLYEEVGEAIFSELDGMFAIALYDFKKKQLFLARDRFGKKPLYWSRSASSLVFASEIKSLLQHPDVTKELDVRSLSQYLLMEYVPTPNSIFKGIHKLEPGMYLRVGEEGLEKIQYWNLADTFKSTSPEISLSATTNRLDELIESAVEKRLVSDVPIGSLLSGGLDSSTIAYYMSRVSEQPIDTFSIGFSETSFDESAEAKQVSEHIGSRHHELKLSAHDSSSLLLELAEELDEPLADASIIPTFLLSRFVRQDITVALGGDGADELFMGYDTFEAERYAQYYAHLPSAVRALVKWGADRLPTSFDNLSFDFKFKKFTSGFAESDRYRHANWLGSFGSEARTKLLSGDATGADRVFEPVDGYFADVAGVDWFNQLSYLYQRTYMMDDILVKVDRASMYNSLEVRTPFLDTDLVSFVNSLPKDYKLKGGTKKYLLKQLMADKLPENIVYRKKKGFGIPVAYWISHELRELVTDYLSPNRLQSQGIFNGAYVDGLLTEHFAKKRDNRKQIWTLLMFQLWYEKWAG